MAIIKHSFRNDLQGRPGNEHLTTRYEFVVPSVPAASTSPLHSLFIGNSQFIEALHIYCLSEDYNIYLRNREITGANAFFYDFYSVLGIDKSNVDDGVNRISNNLEGQPYTYFELVNNDGINATGTIRLVLFVCQV